MLDTVRLSRVKKPEIDSNERRKFIVKDTFEWWYRHDDVIVLPIKDEVDFERIKDNDFISEIYNCTSRICSLKALVTFLSIHIWMQ